MGGRLNAMTASVDSASTHEKTSTGPARIKHHVRSPTEPTVVSVHAPHAHIQTHTQHSVTCTDINLVLPARFHRLISARPSNCMCHNPKIRTSPVSCEKPSSATPAGSIAGGGLAQSNPRVRADSLSLAVRSHGNRLIPGATRVSLAYSPLMSDFGLGQACLLDIRFPNPACDTVLLLSLYPPLV